MHIRLALAAGLLLIASAAAATLGHAPLVPARSNSAPTHTELVTTRGPAQTCQDREVVPGGTSAVRLGLTTTLGPRVTVKLLAGRRLLAQGTRAAGEEGASLTVPVRPAPRATVANVRICVLMTLVNSSVTMLGWKTREDRAVGGEGKPLPGRMHVEYLRPATESWWAMASATMHRLGFGRAAPGDWNALLVLALGALLIALSSWLLVRELG